MLGLSRAKVNTPKRTVDVPCPACASGPIVVTVPSLRGAYCLCEACGHLWHQEGVTGDRRRKNVRNAPQRRSTDKAHK